MSVFGILSGVVPGVVVPAFMDVLTHGEDVSPSRVIIRSLELSGVLIDSLVSNISKEPFDLSHHSDVASFVRDTDGASSTNLRSFLRLGDKDAIKWNRIVLKSAPFLASLQILSHGRNVEVLVGVQSGKFREDALSNASIRSVIIVDTLLITNLNVVIIVVLLHQRRETSRMYFIFATTSKGALEVG